MDQRNKIDEKNYTIYDLEIRRMEKEEASKRARWAFYKRHKGKIISLSLALLTLFCLFQFGFFKSLGIWVVMLIGYSIGAFFDRDLRYINFLKRLFN